MLKGLQPTTDSLAISFEKIDRLEMLTTSRSHIEEQEKAIQQISNWTEEFSYLSYLYDVKYVIDPYYHYRVNSWI